jgi:dihydrofolate reductase
MKVSIIVASSLNDVIGVNNQLPWHLPADLKYFKNLTTGHAIVMGRKTFDSIGRALPNRENIVITRSKKKSNESIIFAHSIEESLDYCNKFDEVFIIGGDNIYQQTIGTANLIYRTKVHTIITAGEAFFPILDATIWQLSSSDFHAKDDKNEFDYTFEIYERI